MDRDEKNKFFLDQYEKIVRATLENRLEWKQINPLTFQARHKSYVVSLLIISDDITSMTKFIASPIIAYYTNDDGISRKLLSNLSYKLQVFFVNEHTLIFSMGYEDCYDLNPLTIKTLLVRLFNCILLNMERRNIDKLESFTSDL